jgi:hypothetical protein
MRHLFLEYPDDAQVLRLDTQYLLGRELLVAPVIEQGARQRKLYLPQGVWIDYASGAHYEGPGWLTADAPLGHVPVYVRSGSIVPKLDPEVETIRPATAPGVVSLDQRADVLEVHVWPDGQQASRFTLADGTTLEASPAAAWFPPQAVHSGVHGQLPAGLGGEAGYQIGPGTLRVHVRAAEDEIEIAAGAAEPAAPALRLTVRGPERRRYRFVVHAPQPATRVAAALNALDRPAALAAALACLGALWMVLRRRSRRGLQRVRSTSLSVD